MATKAADKIILSRSQDIPFNKLVLSQANVRRVKAGVSIADLAEDIARRTLLQSLSVRAQVDGEGKETGLYEVPTGGRRYRALELLVKQKRLARNAPIPCVIRTEGLGEEDSLAENLQRVALHPLDQFRAFQTLMDKGLSEEDIAARFFVTPAVVKQRLRLASVSPKLLEIYAEDGMNLDMLMAFSVSDSHERQEQVWASLTQPWQKEPYHIRRALTASSIHAYDKRARFAGLEAYIAAGGPVMRDLFTPDEGGWLGDVPLLERLVAEKLAKAAEGVMAEGWKWVEVNVDFLYGHTVGQRRLKAEIVPRTEEEEARYAELTAEYERLAEEHDTGEDIPEEVDQRLTALSAEIAQLEERPERFDPDEMARAGCYVRVNAEGELRVERGFVRREDEPPVEEVIPVDGTSECDVTQPAAAHAAYTGTSVSQEAEPEDEGMKPLSDRLVMELTTHRTLALRDALARDPDTAFLAVLHALCLETFYPGSYASCLEISARGTVPVLQEPSLRDCAAATAIVDRHENWRQQMPARATELWDVLVGFDADSRSALFAHCVAGTVNAVHENWNRHNGRLNHADTLAGVLDLDMADAGWVPTVDNFLGRVTKARILEAVREAKGAEAAQRIEHLKKPEMAAHAQELLTGTGWLPELLRKPGQPKAEVVTPVDDAVADANLPVAAE
ncbi:ParB N-terminal domain-containing protein [Niveispirillum sp. KHB5.9]|uniref:ParB/RepB/Spo0J family partition protein n=1 Tax=Niveispirillum sp. KHB5.9 TaxID=3400269 RepID=UPI003A876BE3